MKMREKLINLKNKVKESQLRLKRDLAYAIILGYTILACDMKTYAFQNSIYVTGTKKLFGDALKAIQLVAVGVIIFLLAWWELKKRVGEDNEEGVYNKKQKASVVALILIETIGTIIGIVGGYYGVTVS